MLCLADPPPAPLFPLLYTVLRHLQILNILFRHHYIFQVTWEEVEQIWACQRTLRKSNSSLPSTMGPRQWVLVFGFNNLFIYSVLKFFSLNLLSLGRMNYIMRNGSRSLLPTLGIQVVQNSWSPRSNNVCFFQDWGPS